jgi:hypothetical protein
VNILCSHVSHIERQWEENGWRECWEGRVSRGGGKLKEPMERHGSRAGGSYGCSIVT